MGMAQTTGHQNRLLALDRHFPSPWRHKTDSDIESIARILRSSDLKQWAKEARLYSILRMIDRLDLMDDLLHRGFRDLWLPLPSLRIPSALRSEFAKAQKYVLTRDFSGTARWPYRRHLSFSQEQDVPLGHRHRREIGNYEVDLVYESSGNQSLATKCWRRGPKLEDDLVMKMIQQEIRITKRLCHRHCVDSDCKRSSVGAVNGSGVNSLRYVSPEGCNQGDLIGSSDVWSLGCVFLEMLTVIARRGVAHLERWLVSHSPDSNGVYGRATSTILLYIQQFLRQRFWPSDPRVVDLTQGMLDPRAENRPTARQIASQLRGISEDGPQWCGRCCIKHLTDDGGLEGLYHFVARQEAFTEADIQFISRRLAWDRLLEWSSIPRTYIVLCLMDKLDLMPKFLQAGVSDIWFPYDKQLIRQLLSNQQVVQDFLAKQNTVLSKKLVVDVHQHQHILDGDGDEYLPRIKGLGSGGFGSVWHVYDPGSDRELAKKLIPRVKVVLENRAKDAANIFQRELATLRRLSVKEHRHLVRVVGSYTDQSDFVLLFSPVADMNLGTYLDDRTPQRDFKHLERWFGCLATALQYLHNMKIRHKDIKPQNVLVKGDNVLLADFGISYDWSSNSRPTTSGPGSRDPRYCAPEVADWEARNESSDIFSLGCVFLEMFSTLKGHPPLKIRQYFEENGTGATWYHKNQEALRSFSNLLYNETEIGDRPPLSWISAMTCSERSRRLSSSALVERILDTEGMNEQQINRFCGKCCIAAYTASNTATSELALSGNARGS
ncbi:hypothetical protein FGG08_003866 [Glutinoglossum americanum]|uniref:Protein kinase domain-containing protein n=1 Tax=Glutinoglossum americanum TaxID=1670608 RepID=A0A9P8L4F2_9PEZI|nr:hypothetical protein FGG08_003866 [Glutinoglossum americanum]